MSALEQKPQNKISVLFKESVSLIAHNLGDLTTLKCYNIYHHVLILNKMPKPSPEVTSQLTLVPMLNLYLQANKIDLKANKTGICNGLAAVYCKYALEDKEEEFLIMLQYIEHKGKEILYAQEHGVAPPPSTNDKFSNLDDSKANKFIGEVLFAYLPKEFNKTLNQDDSIQLLKFLDKDGVTQKPIVKEYNLALVADVKDWSQIFNKLKVEGTAWTVGTPTHAISVFVKNGEFRVYDPNHTLIDICKDGKSLAKLLTTVFPDNDKAATLLPLTINICSHPDKPSNHQYPTKEWIFKNLLKKEPDKINQFMEINGHKFDSLAMAVLQNDVEQIRLCFEKGASNPEVALQLAARDNRLDAIDVLLKDEHRKLIKNPDKVYVESCRLALETGRYEAFERLLKDEAINAAFCSSIRDAKNRADFLQLVATSGSPQCIEKLVECYQKNIADVDIPALIKSSNAIGAAEKSGNKRSVQLLCNLAGVELQTSQEKSLVDFPSNDKETRTLIEGFCTFIQFINDMIYAAISLILPSAKKQETLAYTNTPYARLFKPAPDKTESHLLAPLTTAPDKSGPQ
ncbi:TPA: hypothetical protein ACPSKB_000089 [Legionella feeleii]